MTKKKSIVCVAVFAAISCLCMATHAKDITVTVEYGFDTIDPYDSLDTISMNVTKSFYEGLFTFDKDMKVVPVLAEGYKVSEDGLTYTVTLKQGVKFSDGEDFNAAAVKANFDRVLNPQNALSRYALFNNIAFVEPLSDYTVAFHLKKRFSAFINKLAHPSAAMICPKLIEKAHGDKKLIAFHSCGTGPFIQEKYNPAEYLKVKKNPNYRIAGLPKLDGITFRPTPEAGTVAAMLKTGEADYAIVVAPEQVETLKQTGKVDVEVVPSIVQRQAYINVTKKPFDDVRVRYALNYAINKDALVKVVYRGYAVPATGIAPKGVDFATQFGAWPYDPKKAKELLKEAGYPNGFKATLWAASNTTAYQKLLQFMQQQLAQVGVKVEVRALESGQRVALIESPKGPKESTSNMVIWGWSASTGELDWQMRPLLNTASWPPSLSNFGYYSNPKVDQLMDDALATTDRAKKQAIYDEAQKIVWKDAPWIFLCVDQMVVAHNKHLKNFFVQPDGGLEFSQAEWIE